MSFHFGDNCFVYLTTCDKMFAYFNKSKLLKSQSYGLSQGERQRKQRVCRGGRGTGREEGLTESDWTALATE